MFDAFMYCKGSSGIFKGETQDHEMSKMDAIEIISFDFGVENTINIGSVSGGGGAGKATFKEFNITKKTDTASTDLFHACCSGSHFDDVYLVLRRAAGVSAEGKSGKTFIEFHFKLVMVQDIGWSGSDGDDVCEEAVILQYGAIHIKYYPQQATGKHKDAVEAIWSRVKNSAVMAV
ncbi:MAG: type VI secretion system tube protein Hcp [Pseudomonadota bacterium]